MKYLGTISNSQDIITKGWITKNIADVIPDGSITADKLADGAGTVTSVNGVEPDSNGNITLAIPSKTSDLTNNSGFLSSVATANITDKAVTAAKIADSTITQSKMAADSIGTNQLQVNSVTTNIIKDSAVTTAKIADKAVTTAKINDKAVTAAKIGTDVTYSTIGLSASQVRTIYVGTSAPSSSTGSNGDIYLTYS